MLTKNNLLQILLILTGLSTIALTYLPPPFDNLIYIGIGAYLVFMFYISQRLNSKNSTYNYKNFITIVFMFELVLFLVGIAIYFIKIKPNL